MCSVSRVAQLGRASVLFHNSCAWGALVVALCCIVCIVCEPLLGGAGCLRVFPLTLSLTLSVLSAPALVLLPTNSLPPLPPSPPPRWWTCWVGRPSARRCSAGTSRPAWTTTQRRRRRQQGQGQGQGRGREEQQRQRRPWAGRRRRPTCASSASRTARTS